MANTKAIKNKIKAIGSIKKITKTMEMVAVSKMKKSVSETVNISDYVTELKFILNKIKDESQEKNVYFNNNSKNNSESPELVIIFASNKGLCGSFNTNLYKQTKKLVDGNPNIKFAICFGKYGIKIARKLNLEIKISILDIEKINLPTQMFKIEKFARQMYLSYEISKVQAVYTNFVKMGIFETRAVQLYPINKNLNVYLPELNSTKEHTNSKKIKSLYLFEPDVEAIIANTVPKIIKMILFSYILESRASENSSRSFAMKRANESAGELLGELKISYNKIRQDGITQEIAEISAGAAG